MEKVLMKARSREEVGKKANKKIRGGGDVPAVVYRRGKKTAHISVSEKELFHALHTRAGENVLITLSVEGAGGKKPVERTVLIKEMQQHPIRDSVLHVDFQEISLTERIEVNVAVEAKGEAEGAVKDGGVLEHMLWEVRVECLPADIPGNIPVDVTPMKIGDKIYIRDLVVPPGVKILNEPDVVVLGVEMPQAEEPEPEEAEEEALAEPEVIGEKERAARAAEKETARAEEKAGKSEDKDKAEEK